MAKKKIYDAERYAVLAAAYAKAGTEVSPENVGAYRTKTVRAGDCIYVSCYPLISSAARADQEKLLKELETKRPAKAMAKYARYNNRRRVREFEILCDCNLVRGDLHVACTYEPPQYGMPDDLREEWRSREDARREMRNYINRIKRLLRRHGCDLSEFRWLLVTVTREGDPEARVPVRPVHHHHLLMHGVPEALRSDVEKLWPHGYCNADRLQPNDRGLSEVAKYVARQEGRANGDHRLGEKSYTTSRNIKRPTVTTSDSRISRRRVAQIAADVRANGLEIFPEIYPGYRLVEDPVVTVSDFVAGAYIWAKLRRTDDKCEEEGDIYARVEPDAGKERNIRGSV